MENWRFETTHSRQMCNHVILSPMKVIERNIKQEPTSWLWYVSFFRWIYSVADDWCRSPDYRIICHHPPYIKINCNLPQMARSYWYSQIARCTNLFVRLSSASDLHDCNDNPFIVWESAYWQKRTKRKRLTAFAVWQKLFNPEWMVVKRLSHICVCVDSHTIIVWVVENYVPYQPFAHSLFFVVSRN